MPEPGTRIEDLLRDLAPQVLGALARRYGHFDLAEDAVQEALLAAASQWPADGIPASPRGWLITVAARRLTDLLRSEEARQRREEAAARQVPAGDSLAAGADAPPVTAHRRAGVSHPAAGRRFTQRWTRRPRRGEFAGGGDLGHNKPPRPHSLKLYTRDSTGRDPVTARGVDQATCRVTVVRRVLGRKYDVAGQQCHNGTTRALEETPGRSGPELSADFGHAADLQVRAG